jgi:hypothetical protein
MHIALRVSASVKPIKWFLGMRQQGTIPLLVGVSLLFALFLLFTSSLHLFLIFWPPKPVELKVNIKSRVTKKANLG